MRKLPSTAGGYIAIARRRWKLFLIPLVIIPPIVFFVSQRLPRSYHSTASVLIQTQNVPKNLVDDSLQNDVKDRFESISNLILSQSRLIRIVDDLGLYKLQGVSSREEAVAKLRKDLTIEMEGSGERSDKQDSALFKITYVAPTAQLAQDVTREVANLSIAGNLESRERQAEGNIVFIQAEVDRAQAELQDKEERLNAFRAQHADLMPEQSAANLQMLAENQTLAIANSEAIDRADQQRMFVISTLDAESAAHSAAPGTPAYVGDPLLAQKREELRIARQRYTDNHPDVTRLQSEINTLQQRAAKAQGAPDAAPAAPSASQQQLRTQLNASVAELLVRKQRQAEIERKMRDLNGRVQVSPVVAGEGRQLQSDYETAQKYYNGLVEKQHTSTMSADLEKVRGHDLVQVLDPANLPHGPDSPNLRLINLGGLGFALMLGLLLALVVDLFDPTFHDQEDLAAYLDVPMIAIIPTFF